MKNRYRLVIIWMLITAFASQAQEVVKLLPEKFNDYALNYYLPQTIIEVEFVATKTTYKSGPLYQYAPKYLGSTDAITHDEERWSLDYATVIPRGIANTDNRYQLTFKSGQTPYIYVSTENTILSVNTEPQVGERAGFEPVSCEKTQEIDMTKVLTEEILMSGSVAKMAELTAKQIYYIRQSRMDIITGESDNLPSDGESLRIIIEQLEQQEAALTALFMGQKITEKAVKRVVFVPATEDVAHHILARFSTRQGFVDAADLSGAPIYLSMNITERGEYPVDNKGNIKRVPKGAVAYNIPGKATFTVQCNNEELIHEDIYIAQLGVVFGLEPSLLTNKKEPTYILFDAVTGGISTIGSVKAEK